MRTSATQNDDLHLLPRQANSDAAKESSSWLVGRIVQLFHHTFHNGHPKRKEPVKIIAFHPFKASLVAIAFNSSVMLYDTTTGTFQAIPFHQPEGGSQQVLSLAWCHEVNSLLIGLSAGVLYLRLNTSVLEETTASVSHKV